MANAVTQLGLELIVVNSMEETSSSVATNNVFDTILVDNADHIELIRDIKHLRYTPLVLVASYLPELNLKHCLDFGVANVIQTPASVQDVGNALTSALESSNRSVGQADGDVTYKILLAEDSKSFTVVRIPMRSR